MDRRKLGMAMKFFGAMMLMAAAPSLQAPLHAQDVPAQREAQKKGTGQVPAGVTLSPQMPAA
ncbi:MAG TPA: hypothetical protein VGR03_12225, partial [Candidatus Acidoferrum sp.]|nr:hypothetical protein [Candidatus Acidoferrum sp.]